MKKNVMPFPSQYKNKLLSGKKNLTVRIGKEMGKYRKGREYDAQSYSGKDWGFKVRVNTIITTKFKDLHKHVPKQVAKMKDFVKLDPKDKVQVIHIKPLIDLSHRGKMKKEAAVIPLPPETEKVWAWVEKNYARWALIDIMKPRITQKQYKAVENQVDEIQDKIDDLLPKIYNAKTLKEEVELFLTSGLFKDFKIPIMNPELLGAVDEYKTLYVTLPRGVSKVSGPIEDVYIPNAESKAFQKVWGFADYPKFETKMTLKDALHMLSDKTSKFFEKGEPLWDEDLPDYLIMRRKSLQNAKLDDLRYDDEGYEKKPTPEEKYEKGNVFVGYENTTIPIDYAGWEKYNLPQVLVPVKIIVSMEPQRAEDPLGEWDDHLRNLRIFVPKKFLHPKDPNEYEKFRKKLKSTTEHEMRHLVQTLISWGKKLPRKLPKKDWAEEDRWSRPAGLPTTETPGYGPHGYKTEDIKQWDEVIRRAPTSEERKTLVEEKWKQLEKTRLPHALRDIEYHSNIGTVADAWKRRFHQKFPERWGNERPRNEALKAFMAAPPYYVSGGQNKPYFIQAPDMPEVGLSTRVWPNHFL